MFHFTRFSEHRTMYSCGVGRTLLRPGYPIRKFTGYSVFAAYRDLSQLITSFIACWHQGILHVLLVAFFLSFDTEISPSHDSSVFLPKSLRRLSFVNYLEVVIFFPNMQMSKNSARNLPIAGLNPIRTVTCFSSEKFKTRKNGGPDRT